MGWTKLAVGDPGFVDITPERLALMAEAANRIIGYNVEFETAGVTSVSALLPAGTQLFEWSHFPEGDCKDGRTGCQFFYHVHPKLEQWEEHGHFHLFGPNRDANGEAGGLSHLVAISVDWNSQPVRLFTTNRWVTDEIWADGAAAFAMQKAFSIDGRGMPGLVGRWLTDLNVLYNPQIEALLMARNSEIERRLGKSLSRDAVFEDRQLECVSYMEIDHGKQLDAALANAAPE